MKYLFAIASILFSFCSHSQDLRFTNHIFNDSVISEILKHEKISSVKPYRLFSWTDSWQRHRFFYETSGSGRHHEAINLFIYNDTAVSQLITPRQWSFYGHKALPQISWKIKKKLTDIVLVKKDSAFAEGLYFSITQPVFDGKFALVDLSYYVKEKDKHFILAEQCYRGQSLIIFQKQGKDDWKIIRIVSRYIQ